MRDQSQTEMGDLRSLRVVVVVVVVRLLFFQVSHCRSVYELGGETLKTYRLSSHCTVFVCRSVRPSFRVKQMCNAEKLPALEL